MWGRFNRESKLINPQADQDDAREKFVRLMDFAEHVLSKSEPDMSPHPILDVIRLYGRQAQADYMMNTFSKRPKEIRPFDALFKSRKYDISSGICATEWNGNIDLAKDVVLPWPWETRRLFEAITTIGPGRVKGEWEQDTNHKIFLLLPIGVSFVEGGNHSLTAGIVQAQGIITPTPTVYAYHMTQIYNDVETDGVHYFRRDDHSVIADVKWVGFAAIFEIGRKMIERNITY